MSLNAFFSRCADFCRSDLFYSLTGGFAIGALLVTVGAFDSSAELPVAAAVTMATGAG